MSKIACVFSFKASNWISCQKIVFNLHKSYANLGSDYQLINFNYSDEVLIKNNLSKLASEIFEQKPEIISFLDHRPHPLELFEYLFPLYREKDKPKIIFHIFGDFSLYFTNWDKLEKILLNFPVEFLVASDRQKELIDNMLLLNQSTVCPFPVDDKEFYFDADLRTRQRQQWGVKDEDRVYVFTGRLSRQKRTKTLVSFFAEVFKENLRAHLFIYGNPDSIGDPFVGIHEFEGEYFRSFYRTYEKLSEEIRSRIHFKGSVPNQELLAVYCGADVLVNPSVHNDEDYGMSVAESQFTGLPCILSDWGGLASFKHANIPEATSYIPVKIGSKSKLLASTIFKQKLKNSFELDFTTRRLELSNLANLKFGIEHSSSIIKKAIERPHTPFHGFSDLFKKISFDETTRLNLPLFVGKGGKLRKIYKDIYRAYTR